MKRSASAVWHGDLKAGKGEVSGESKAFNGLPYSFTSRFESGTGTNPEELIAAAHAGCFAMMTTALLGKAGFTADTIRTKAVLTLEQVNGAWTITASDLELSAKVPGIDKAQFDAVVADAKNNCPVSRLLNAKIGMQATLE